MNSSTPRGFDPGARVVILRKGRPWRQGTITERCVASVIVNDEFEYSILTRQRRGGTQRTDDELVVWTQAHEDYLTLKDFKARLADLPLHQYDDQTLRVLAELAQVFLTRVQDQDPSSG